jgi:hypothetical protein
MGIFTDNQIVQVGGQLRPSVSGTGGGWSSGGVGGGGSGYAGSYTVDGSYTGNGSYTNNTSEDQVIQGKMLTVTNVIKQYDLEILPDDQIKRKMIYELAEEMAKSNMVEFTKQIDHATHCVNIRARCFMVPDTHVRILRVNGIK